MRFFLENSTPLIKTPTALDFLNNLDGEQEAFPSLMPNMTSQLGTEGLWDKIRPKRMPCKCYIESASRTPTKSLGKFQNHIKFPPSQTKDPPQQPVPPPPQLWCGTAAQPGLSLRESSPVGKHHVGSLGSASTLLWSCFPALPA